MSFRPYGPPAPLLVEFDPYRDLPTDHLARLVESVVEDSISVVSFDGRPGQPGYDARLLVKVLLYGYCTGIRSSRQLERLCQESMPYMFLTRGAHPGFRTLCTARVEYEDVLTEVWAGLYMVADRCGLKRVGRIVLDSTKITADASPESIVRAEEFARVQQELELILKEAKVVDAREDQDGGSPGTRLGTTIKPDQMRDILRQVRSLAAQSKAELAKTSSTTSEANPQKAVQSEEASDKAEQTEAPSDESKQTKVPSDEPVQVETLELTLEIEVQGTSDSAEPPTQVQDTVCSADCATKVQRHITHKMLGRIKAAIENLKSAGSEGLKHLCLTDPEARMMPEGRYKRLKECHSFEAAVDQGLLVVAQACQEGADNKRLLTMIDSALEHEPNGITAVDADSGYWRGDDVVSLVQRGIDTCIPDGFTACDLRRSQAVGTTKSQIFSKISLEYDAQTDTYSCPQNNVLTLRRVAKRNGAMFQEYVAKKSCAACPLKEDCLTQKNAKRRSHKVAVQSDEIAEVLSRFNEAEHKERYRNRGACIETVFGFIRANLGINRWQVRGAAKVGTEAKLIGCAYQIRKIHTKILAPSQ